jgi:hypothetical protein
MTQHLKPTVTRLHSGASAASAALTDLYEGTNGENGLEKEEEQNGWEDEEDHVSHLMDFRTDSRSGSSSPRTVRKRRRPAFVTKVSKKQVPTKSAAAVKSSTKAGDAPTIAREDVVNGLLHGSLFTGKYAMDVSKRALLLLRYPLSFLFFLYLLAFVMNKMQHTLKSIFFPICIVPGFSRSRLCYTPPLRPSDHRPAKWADYPHLVNVESKTFEQLMDGVVGGSALSLEVKQAEMATADLAALVRISDLKAKDTLASSLLVFVESAKKTGRGLQRLSSKVGGAVDR